MTESVSVTTHRWSSLIRRAVRAVPFILAGAAVVHPLATLGARLGWWVDMITHFYVLAFALSLGAAVGLALRGHYRLMLGYLILAAIQAAPLARYSGTNPINAAADSPRLRILMANVYVKNTNFEAIAALIRRERPDIVGFVEVLPLLEPGLAATGVDRDYPYRYVLPVGAQGQAIWFREKPDLVVEPAIFAPLGNPVYRATVRIGGRPVGLWLVHPPNPVGAGHERADPDLKALGLAIGKESGTTLVIGDMNRTEGSPRFTEFLRDSRLRDSRLGFGRQPSWPSWSPYRIPIDHAFLSNDLAVIDRRLGPDIGSDHFPLILDVAFASSTNRSAHHASSSAGPAGSSENLARSTAPK